MKKSTCLTSISYSFCCCLISFILVFMTSINSVVHGQKYYTAESSFAIKLGRTKPLYDLINVAPTDSDKLKERKLNKPTYVPNFQGRRHQDFHAPGALPQGPDPLFNPAHMRSTMNEILPKVNFEGLTQANVNSGVPDVNGDIGREYYVEIVNSTFFKVFDKTGQAVSGQISANAIWNQVFQTSAGDPILLYDQEADRWLLTEFPPNNRVLMAISVSNDPRGAWDAYAFQTPRFPDFPKYGIWPNAYFLTTNEGGANYPIYAFNREDFLAGADIVRFQRLTLPKHGGVFFEVGQPVDWDGMRRPPEGSPGLIVKMHDDDWGTTNQDHIILHKMHIDWETPANSNIEVVELPVSPFDSDGCSMESTGGFACVPQPNGQGIDGAEWIITNKAQYRNFGSHESFVLSFMVDVTGEEVAGIRWMEFRKTDSSEWYLYQEGTVGSDDGLHRFMSSIGIDGMGNIGLAYSVSGVNKHASLRYTGRYASDPLGIMTFQEYEFATGSGSIGTDRFGDYASMSVDPSDDHTFWFAGEYIRNNGNWSTKIVAFAATKETFDIFPVAMLGPQNSPHLAVNEPLTVRVLNRGLNTVYDFKIGYQFDNGDWIEENALTDSLMTDSFYVHTFQTGLNFDRLGNYPLRITTNLDTDRNRLNDTLSFVIKKPGFRDIALQYDVPTQENIVCSTTANNTIRLRNMGADEINIIVLHIFFNSIPVDTITWIGSLEPFEEELFTFMTEGLNEGDNEITVDVLELNNQSDEIPDNNFIHWNLEANPGGEALTLYLTTDNFPNETSWQMLNANDEIIASGGPYAEKRTLYTAEFCLNAESCYTFIILDVFGDGMSAQGVQGDYEIRDSEGNVIAELSKPNFGKKEENQFCLTGECMFRLETGIQHESVAGASDAWVMAETSNALGMVTYELNGTSQTENTFLDLSAGDYILIGTDGAGCSDTVSFTIHSCNISTLITTSPASGGDVGEIHISAIGGKGELMYSLNGMTFTNDTFFTMLEPGDYIIYTKDSVGCIITDTVTVSTSVSTSHNRDGHFIRIYPNPGQGVFQVSALFDSQAIFTDYTVYSANGEPLTRGTLARYNHVSIGEISLVAFPDGLYYVAFYTQNAILVRKLVKSR